MIIFGLAMLVFGYAIFYWGFHHFMLPRYALSDVLGIGTFFRNTSIPQIGKVELR